MSQVLKVLELAQNHGMPQVQVGRRRVHPKLDPQRLSRGPRLLQLGAEIGLTDDFRGALLEIRHLFVDGCEGRHEKGHYKELRAKQ